MGFYENDTWYVVETIDPGPRSIFEVAYFEYDQKYVTHLINKIARLYKRNLSLLGLWHRHPGSFDVFSNTDDSTNATYAKLATQGAISALVNIDPEFRLKVFHVSLPHNRVSYEVIPYKVGDDLFPEGSLDIYTKNELERKINSFFNNDYSEKIKVKIAPRYSLEYVVETVCKKMNPYDIKPYKDEIISAKDDDFLECISNVIVDDLDYLASNLGLQIKVAQTNRYMFICDENDKSNTRVYFSRIKSRDEYIFIYKSTAYKYVAGLFSKHFMTPAKTNEDEGFFSKIKRIISEKKKGEDDNA